MLLTILGVLDVVIGAALWMSSGSPITGSTVILVLSLLWMFKGGWSILSSAAAGWFFDYMGIPDLIAGVLLMMSYLGISFGFFFYVALIMLAKGLWSFLIGLKV